MMPMGEIKFEDGTKVLVPQPSRDIWIQLRDAYVTDTIPELPDRIAVLQYIHEHADSNANQRTDPRWAVLCVRWGASLLVGSMAVLAAIRVIA
jgi:hypothetical protein